MAFTDPRGFNRSGLWIHGFVDSWMPTPFPVRGSVKTAKLTSAEDPTCEPSRTRLKTRPRSAMDRQYSQPV